MNVRDEDLSRDELLALVKGLRERLGGSERYNQELRGEIDKIAEETTRNVVGAVTYSADLSPDCARTRALEITLNPITRRAIFQHDPRHFGPHIWEDTIKRLAHEIAVETATKLGRQN